ncbi:MAG TPA: carboxylating nicotinate-nucleotide diphosphorylase [Stellaceae bacterium]|jgi:nicotinate-nucleotide pyrophosphorylase (carboxylating)|nr:carboxylating nicotinate-nucleotide diphosphorylase [Stellaceae bacterium]
MTESNKDRLPIAPLPNVLLEPLVRTALLEDLGRAGDLTSDSIIPADLQATMVLNARQKGVVAGLDVALLAFKLIDPRIEVTIHKPDGSDLAPGDIIATVKGPARGMLTAERVALNFLGHMSGIASATAAIVASIQGHKAHIACTRKTMPGLRAVQKYAIRAGGGSNHRFGLDDAVLIKDNHIAVAGSIGAALARAKAGTGHLVKIQIEVDNLDQLSQVIKLGADAVLLDNMKPPMMAEAVKMVAGRMITEASGRINAETAPIVAATGVDLISIGWLTHSSTVLDIGLDDA